MIENKLYIHNENDSDNSNWDAMLETPPLSAYDSCQNLNMYYYDNYNFQDSFIPYPAESLSYQPTQMPTSLFDYNTSPKSIIPPSQGTYAICPTEFAVDQIKFEQIYNEIPSRSLQIANIPSNATKDDFNFIFSFFGDVQTADYSQIERGIATVQFYDMESAQKMRLSEIFVRSKRINLIFRPEEIVKDAKHPNNNGTIVLFHLPRNTDDKTLTDLFSQFGKIRQVRHTPYKESQRFIEFYDIRGAEKALEQLNGTLLDRRNPRSKIAIEFSLPGGFKKNVQKFYRSALPTIVRNNNKATRFA
ncbi:hypothetical protein TRFO_39724 [Tritrichomonas foetus]|uniref:RRM domain-containing protein n=1 Tax=Tritrichomonas foetus TaxID=1144522 RepID=A0A1J4J5Y5_9EUKA|nr:hypothetical protein TRFO_39724 [Tritrichomonas foetus]|eukprot:OHS94073.1 hypothetical protein TRFO_39724 [Tritrichomonas foetus]